MGKKTKSDANAEATNVNAEATTSNESTGTPGAKVKADSVRQKAFALLDGSLSGMGRKEATEKLMAELQIGNAYAGTIFQDHRKKAKSNGKLVSTFRVQGDDTELKVVTRHVVAARPNDHLTAEAAVNSYVAGLQAKIDAARKLDLSKTETAA